REPRERVLEGLLLDLGEVDAPEADALRGGEVALGDRLVHLRLPLAIRAIGERDPAERLLVVAARERHPGARPRAHEDLEDRDLVPELSAELEVEERVHELLVARARGLGVVALQDGPEPARLALLAVAGEDADALD